MADTRISNAAAIDAVNALTARLENGIGALQATIIIYDGTPPTDVDAAPVGTVLASLDCTNPAFPTAVDLNPGAQATANPISDATAAATGTAQYFRAIDLDSNAVIQGDVTISGGGGDLQLATTAITSGITVSVLSWTITLFEA